jgi:vitamin B12 transporter
MVIVYRRRRALLACLASSTICFASLGHATGDDELAVLVVTATRIPTPEIQIASSVTVITADEIAARQVRTLPDVLKDVPGLNVVQTGGPGGQTSIFMRGTNSNHTKVLVDGIDVGDPSNPNGAFDFGQFLAQDIERVEILRGPQSGLYGSDAIGGVINIITKSGTGPAQFNVSAEGGSFDTFNQTAAVRGSADQFHYAANIEHIHSGATPVTPLDLLAPGEARIDDYDDNVTGSTKLGLDVTDHFDLGLVARYTDTHLRLTGENYNNYPAPATPDSAQSSNDTKQYYTRFTAHGVAFDGLLNQTLGIAYSNTKIYELSPDSPETDFFAHRFKADWQGNLQLGQEEILVLGAEHQRDGINQPITADTTISSGYAELQSAFANELFNTLSARYDHNSQFGDKVTFRVAPAYVIADTGTKLKASFGSGFKAPTLEQQFQSFPAFLFFANPDLKPESSLGYDFGIEQMLLGDALRLGVTLFRNNIRDLITDSTNPTTFVTTEVNVGRAITQGVESFVSYRPISTLTLRVDYTYTEATDEILQQELLRRPKQKASLNSNWRPTPRWSVDTTLLYVGRWADISRDGSEQVDAPGYTTIDAATGYDLTDHWTIFGRVNNLLDRHYENPIGFLQPSIGVFAGIKAKF